MAKTRREDHHGDVQAHVEQDAGEDDVVDAVHVLGASHAVVDRDRSVALHIKRELSHPQDDGCQAEYARQSIHLAVAHNCLPCRAVELAAARVKNVWAVCARAQLVPGRAPRGQRPAAGACETKMSTSKTTEASCSQVGQLSHQLMTSMRSTSSLEKAVLLPLECGCLSRNR